MLPADRRCRGYSLIELLVVLAIVGALAWVGALSFRPNSTDAVRSEMAEIEGVLTNAQNAADLSTQDIYVSTTGNWIDGSFILDARPFVTTGTNAVSSPPSTTTTPPQATPGNTTYRIGAVSECFRSLYPQHARVDLSAGVDTTTWYGTALNGAGPLAGTPVANLANFALALGNPLCTGVLNSVVMNRANRQFNTGFYIAVVGLSGGAPIPGGPVGVIVVPAGSANVYKFFKPNGSNTWGRL